MNGLTLLLIASACFLGGYFLYSRLLGRVLGIDPSRPTPAHTRRDGVDYIPAHPTVLFGHHFAAIAGAGPIVGPVLAAEFGWASVALCALVFVALVIVMIQTAPKKPAKAPVSDEVTLDAPLFIPDAPNLEQDYYPSRTTGTVWTSDEIEQWFTTLDEKSLEELEKANDTIVSDITGAEP